jgi:hypothetical protein
VDSVAQMAYGIRYYLSSGSSTYQHIGSRSGSFYTLNYPQTALNVGGIADPSNPSYTYFGTAYGTIQYMRLFLDYAPTTADEFLNLALMDSASKIIVYLMRADVYLIKVTCTCSTLHPISERAVTKFLLFQVRVAYLRQITLASKVCMLSFTFNFIIIIVCLSN